jgi:hypothetical protein
MFAHDDPFWFASSELLTRVFHAELVVVMQFLTKHPDVHNLLDSPEATTEERSACFALLAHRALVGMIDEQFTARYEESPSLDGAEFQTLKSTFGLVAADAPAWLLEMHQVVERLPAYIYTSLPEALRMGGCNPDNAEQMQAIESARKTLGSVEQIQTLTERVIDQQLERLVRRWSASAPSFQTQTSPMAEVHRPKGFEGLPRKNLDLSRYMGNLTAKQWMAFSLKNEYGLGLAEIASRMGLNRKTAYGHIQAANTKIDQDQSSAKRKINRAKTSHDE